MELIREKDIYTYITERGNRYSFDVKNKIVIGAKGCPIKSFPTALKAEDLSYHLFNYCNNKFNAWEEHRRSIEQLISFPTNYIMKKKIICMILNSGELEEKYVLENWKEIVHFLKAGKDRRYQCILETPTYYSIAYFIRAIKTVDYCTEREMNEFIPILLDVPQIIKLLPDKNFEKLLKQKSIKKIKKGRELLLQKLSINNEEILSKSYGIKYLSDDELAVSVKTFIKKYLQAKDWLKKIGKDDYIIKNLDKEFDYIKALFEKEVFAKENEKFCKAQLEKDLSFEDDNYKIYIPTSRQELQIIGDRFHNCVNRFEWDNYLQNGQRFLVVVVEKETNKMKVCCDISRRSLHIIQYLGVNNTKITDENLLKFQKDYQNYLLN